MVEWNERKLQVLEYVEERGTVTSRDVADALDLEIHNARTLLHKYHRQSLLTRYTADAYGSRIYAITERGEERIEWLRRQFEGRGNEWT